MFAGMNDIHIDGETEAKQGWQTITSVFPQIYRTAEGAYMVSARSSKWGLNERKTFPTESLAREYRTQINEQIQLHGKTPTVPQQTKVYADAYEKLLERLAPFGKSPADAIDFYVKHLGDEILRQAKPTISPLVDEYLKHKFAEHSGRYRHELETNMRYLKKVFGERRIDDVSKNEIRQRLIDDHSHKNTRRKYLCHIRMFFQWVIGEQKEYLTINPTAGIYFEPAKFDRAYYQLDTLKEILKYVATEYPQMLGYYTLLTFAGLRPDEGGRVKWAHITLDGGNLHVVPGKTDPRDITLEPVALRWLNYYKAHSTEDASFLPATWRWQAVQVRKHFAGKWIADGLRHGFATMYQAKIQDPYKTAFYLGNSPQMIRQHYAQSLPASQTEAFWSLTPEDVIEDVK